LIDLVKNEEPDTLTFHKAALLQQAQKKWDTGVTSTTVEANYDYIDSLTDCT
jgi:hypothetical protein